MQWNITYFNKAIYKQVSELPKTILGSYVAIANHMKTTGPHLGLPHTRPMGNGLFEIRAKGKEGIGRIFFALLKEKEIIILHSFIKKTQETPRREIEIALRRLKEVNKDG